MKSAKCVITEIQNSTLYKNYEDLNDFLKLFSQTHQKVIAFIYQKNEILYIACKHNAGLQELKRDSNIKNIKDLLKMFLMARPNSELKNASDIRIFVATNYMKRKIKMMQTLQKERETQHIYYEKSSGKFKNNIKDKKAFEIFEEIRKLIIASKTD
ncbi:hypothetical protein CBLAS_0500 [Campylobacter blaseri]|uniref:Uncharacterized protein n=1 Tax=Campylobacter blaseri TaxID=2042961 RepID=A0A2P8R0D4_9BACT|nr:hypothetical protein [Campylobacter blaseri]PSM51965.1 hypothetical protein CQ405_05220 [Campylobacter blaseri]PSM53750.1 hypothetical protein CRN67_05225 [Campylobacter blaseri]QKF85696.1 hypothetical protein CBLAS_0500 [Campylobacter blaseri]